MFQGLLRICALLSLLVALPMAATAQTAMDDDAYSWSVVGGWVNWNVTNGDVDFDLNTGELTGYLWGEGIGWIELDPPNAGVTISFDSGTSWTCDGYAWSTVAGWVNFNPSGPGGVVLDLTNAGPHFTGQAWAEGIGWIETTGANHGTDVDPTRPVADWMLY